MIKKWELKHTPTVRDPLRHKLSLDCEMKDVFFLMKKLGAVCSRPEKVEGEYSYSLYLLKADNAILDRAKSAIEGLSEKKEPKPEIKKETFSENVHPEINPNIKQEAQKSKNEVDEKKDISESVNSVDKSGKSDKTILDSSPRAEEKDLKPDIQKNEIKEKTSNSLSSNVSFESQKPHITDKAKNVPPPPPKPPTPNFSSLPEINIESLGIDLNKPTSPEMPKAANQSIHTTGHAESSKKPVPDNPAHSKDLSESNNSKTSAPKPGHAIPPSISIRAKKEEPKEEPKTEKEELVKNKPESMTAKIKTKWPIELPLNPTLTFQTLIAGPHNRFAHAAAMAVVENPGVMYNPLLIFGHQGIGKSHFIHAIGYGLSSSIGQKNIFVTHAVKFSKGVDLAIEKNNIKNLEAMLNEVKVLIIDDIDLLMLSEKNRPFISKILNDCVAANKQIIISSMFPPKALSALEEQIGFQFTQGWMVDIKLPNAQTYRLILNQMLSAIDIKISEDDIKTFFVSKMLDFRTVSKILSYTKKMEKYMSGLDQSLIHKDFISMLLGLSGDDETFPSDADVSSAALDVSSKDQWFKWGIFYPKGMKNHAFYALSKMREFASSEFKIDLRWEQVFVEEYNPDEIYGIPFKIGETAISHQVNGTIIIGPQSTSALGAKEQEFRNITEKIMESFSIKVAWLESSKLKARGNYLRALMELL